MTTELTPSESFEQKIKEKLTKDIGNLMPDEVLTSLIEKAIQDCFFKDQRSEHGAGFNQKTVLKDSVFKEVVKELLADRVDTIVRNWLNDNREEMTTKLAAFIEESSKQAITTAIFGSVSGHIDLMKASISMDLSNKLNQY